MYVYRGTLPFDTCNGSHNIITFNQKDGANISRPNLDLLKKLISGHKIETRTNNFYINTKGPNILGDNADIYIDCKPVSEDGDVIGDDTNTKKSLNLSLSPINLNLNFKNITKNIYFQIVISLLASIIIIKLFFMLINLLKTNEGFSSINRLKFPRNFVFNRNKIKPL
jgi:hypothetical protein